MHSRFWISFLNKSPSVDGGVQMPGVRVRCCIREWINRFRELFPWPLDQCLNQLRPFGFTVHTFQGVCTLFFSSTVLEHHQKKQQVATFVHPWNRRKSIWRSFILCSQQVHVYVLRVYLSTQKHQFGMKLSLIVDCLGAKFVCSLLCTNVASPPMWVSLMFCQLVASSITSWGTEAPRCPPGNPTSPTHAVHQSKPPKTPFEPFTPWLHDRLLGGWLQCDRATERKMIPSGDLNFQIYNKQYIREITSVSLTMPVLCVKILQHICPFAPL